MAVRAHEIPILRWTRPVKLVITPNPLVGIWMKPALPAVFLRPRVPRDRQRLQPAVGKFDQVLLQRRYTEGVLDFIICQFAVATLGVDEKLSTPLKEGGRESGIGK